MVLALLTLVTAAAPAEVVLLTSPPHATFTELRFQPLGATALTEPVARVHHLESVSVAGALLPKSRSVLAIAETELSRASGFKSQLFRLDAKQAPVVLTDRVARGTRPLVTPAGRVFVQRGVDGENGVDALTIDEVNPKTGKTRSIHSYAGYWAFIAGAFEGEVLVYRSGPERADLVAVHADSMGVRTLVREFPALARDFAVDAANHALFYTQGDQSTGRWHVERVDLRTLERTTVAEGPEVAMLPTVLPGGLAYVAEMGRGLRFAGGDAVALAPRGAGFERVRAVTRDGVAVGLHQFPSDFPFPFAVELKSGKGLTVAAPKEALMDVVGVIDP